MKCAGLTFMKNELAGGWGNMAQAAKRPLTDDAAKVALPEPHLACATLADPYEQDLDGVLSLIPAPLRAEAEEKALQALDMFRTHFSRGKLRLCEVPYEREDLTSLQEEANKLMEGRTDIVHFGTGGSSLGAQALAQVGKLLFSGIPLSGAGRPRMHFLDNLESPWLERALKRCDLDNTAFLIVSKSGRTPETVAQAILAIEILKQRGLADEIPHRILMISDPEDPALSGRNILRRLAADHGIRVLDHEPDVGGRFSVLTNVGMLPALLIGLDASRIRDGACAVIDPILKAKAAAALPPVAGAMVHYALKRYLGMNIVVTMPYTSRLRLFAVWLQQLWAESLGKEGRGTQPVTAVGPVDQHSQLQLYLDGPNDRFFNIIQVIGKRDSYRIPESYAEYTDLAGFCIADLTHAQQRATTDALLNRGRPVRVFRIDSVNEYALGGLFMHFMIETILYAYMLGINPFDQPAVEESKILTRTYLSEMKDTGTQHT